MDWTEWQTVKARIPEGWVLDEAEGTLRDDEGGLVLLQQGDKEMFRALVADALILDSLGG
jgi:hypothetical protein